MDYELKSQNRYFRLLVKSISRCKKIWQRIYRRTLMDKHNLLFPSSEVFVDGDALDNGFYDIELPDGFRWIKKQATCFLNIERSSHYSAPMLVITAHVGSHQSARILSLFVNDQFISSQTIDRYDKYYFDISAVERKNTEYLNIVLNLDYAGTCGNDQRLLGLAIYGIEIIDLNSDWEGFEERKYLATQFSLFRTSQVSLSELLNNLQLTSESLVLDVGGGMGWTTLLLAARTGAQVFCIDLHQYDSFQGISFKSDLFERFERHLPVLLREPDFVRLKDLRKIIQNCTFDTMDAQHLLYKDGLFDFVFSLNAFEHIPSPEAALAEISRVLKPGGLAFLKFMPLYFSDTGHHLFGFTDIPWVHLLYERDKIKQMIIDSGKVPNEIDNILDSLNGYTSIQYLEMLSHSDLKVIEKMIHRGFSLDHSEKSDEFKRLKKIYPEEDLSTIGITVILEKRK